MKKTLKHIAVWTCFICVLLTGCGSGNKTGGNGGSKSDGDSQSIDGQNGSAGETGDPADAKGELSLYCMADDAKIDISLHSVMFMKMYRYEKRSLRTRLRWTIGLRVN